MSYHGVKTQGSPIKLGNICPIGSCPKIIFGGLFLNKELYVV